MVEEQARRAEVSLGDDQFVDAYARQPQPDGEPTPLPDDEAAFPPKQHRIGPHCGEANGVTEEEAPPGR